MEKDGVALEAKCIGCLLGAMIGDALGAPVEGRDDRYIRESFDGGKIDRYHSGFHMGVELLGQRRGMYTDDTQTTLALASSLVEEGALHPQKVGRYL